MALLPKATPIPATSPVASTRSVPVGARVASVSTSQVDALDSGTNISFDTAATAYQQNYEESRLARDGGRRQDTLREPAVNRLFTSDTELFAEIFEDNRAQNATAVRAANEPVGTGTPVRKIISTYETNALIITGQQPIRGTSLSFSL